MPWVLVVALVGAVAYAVGASGRAPEPIAPSPAAPPAVGEQGESPEAPGAAEPPLESVTGVVKEHTDVSQYTYLRLATAKGETWAAVTRVAVKDGATVTVDHAMAMHSFHSKELKRDFETIWFGTLAGSTATPTSTPTATPTPTSLGKMLPGPPGSMAIADLAKKAPSLEGKTVTLAGKVVKENDGIMGKNWIHIQDGSGNAADKSNDLLVTTDGTAKLGDAVVVTGTVRIKQDFGSGYAYDFMLEKASVAPQSAL